ncbi:MAG: NosD domain-containing protein [bacterium]|nr:NosD domain-containing protein [bacterium]
MFKQAILALIGGLVVLAIFPAQAGAASPCAAANIRWSSSSNSVYISGEVECTLTDIKQLGSKYIPLTLVDSANQIWFLGANLFLQQGAKLVLHGSPMGGDVNELRLKSNNLSANDFIKISADWGTIDIDSTKITSWDVNAGGPDTEYATYKRAYIQVRSRLGTDGVTPRESRMDIKNSELGYLGYNSSEAYGLSWKVVTGGFDSVGVFGDITNNTIHHNYFGLYTYGAEAMTFRDNEIYQNIKYGLDPHDDSDYLIIDSNYVHNNGYHGIICSKRCNNLTITNNTSSNNVGNGLMLHRNVNDSLVENNILNDNLDAGLALLDSHGNTIRNNETKRNAKGIRLSVGSSNNLIESNDFSDNTKYGLYFYKGNDAPTSGDGRIKLNTFRNNIVNTNGSMAAKIGQADNNVFVGNEFTGNNSYAAEIKDANNNIFEKNTLLGNVYNYYYAKSSAINTIQDSGAFAVKIGDTLSSMTITDSSQTVYQNSKNIPATVSPLNTTIILNRANASSAIVSFNRLNFTVTPTADSLAIKPLIWNTSGDFSKKWTASNDLLSTTTATYVVGNLAQNTSYDVMINGTLWSSIVTDGSGEITFDYSGVFQNVKTFEVKASL